MSVAFSPAEFTVSVQKKTHSIGSQFISPLIVLMIAEFFTLPFIVADRGFVPNLVVLFFITLLGVVNGAPVILYLAVRRDQQATAPQRSTLLAHGVLFVVLLAAEIVCCNLS